MLSFFPRFVVRCRRSGPKRAKEKSARTFVKSKRGLPSIYGTVVYIEALPGIHSSNATVFYVTTSNGAVFRAKNGGADCRCVTAVYLRLVKRNGTNCPYLTNSSGLW